MLEENSDRPSGRPQMAVRLLEAASRIVQLTTGMPMREAAALFERCALQACREAGFGGFPDESVPLAERYRVVKEAVRLVDEELSRRGVPLQERQDMAEDVLELYRRVRNVPADFV